MKFSYIYNNRKECLDILLAKGRSEDAVLLTLSYPHCKDGLKIGDFATASRFAWTTRPDYFWKFCNHQLPFAFHSWNSCEHQKFLKKHKLIP